MGYLNGNTITVDAILTKHGRRLLAEGKGLNISKFGFSDDGINYDLYNPDHPNGSANYGEALTDLPQLEAVPDDSVIMKYKLMSLDRNTIFMPKIIGITSSITISNQSDKKKISPITENATDSSYMFMFTDVSAVNVTGGSRKDIGGNQRTFLAGAEIPQSAIFTGKEITISAKPTDVGRNLTVQITGVDTGAIVYVDIEISNNIRTLAIK